MNTKAIVIAASVAAVLALLYPIAMAAMPLATSSSTTNNTQTETKISIIPKPPTLSVGQTLTFTSTNGEYRVLSEGRGTGPASGTLTLTVTGVFKHGYTLSITGGSLVINGTTYTLTSGTAQMGRGLAHVIGQGTLSGSGAFMFEGGSHSNFAGQQYNILRFDVEVNGIEYGVLLLVNVTIS